MNWLQFIGIICIPLLALIVSIISLINSNRISNKVNSKDYEISENLKYELMLLIATLKALDAKATLSPSLEVKTNYSHEINEISKLLLSPSYLVLLRSYNNEVDRFWVDFYLRSLSIRGNVMSTTEIRLFTNKTLDLIKNTHIKEVLDLNVYKLMKEFCEMKGASPEYNDKIVIEDVVIDKELILPFLISLIYDGVTDPNVKLFLAIEMDDTDLLLQALNEGADQKIGLGSIIKKYKEKYIWFKNAQMKKSLD